MNNQIINIENMKDICIKCYNNPKSHSFKIVKSNIEIPVFYTSPGEAEDYSDSDAILAHYDNMLNLYGNNEWIWVFNCDKLEIKHSLEFNTARRVAVLLSKKYNKIKQIYILNSNYIFNIILNIIWPFLDDKIKDLIITVDKLPFEIEL
jgi:hypothetical protein